MDEYRSISLPRDCSVTALASRAKKGVRLSWGAKLTFDLNILSEREA
jgi:hypothetical protein